MTSLGLTFGRLRTAFTVISRDLSPKLQESATMVVPEAQVLTKLVPHSRHDIDHDAEAILNSVISTFNSLQSVDRPYRNSLVIGFLGLPPLESSNSSSEIDLFKLHTIVAHEMRKHFKTSVSDVSIGAVRFNLGIHSPKGGEVKKKLIESFKSSGSEHDAQSTSSCYQTMSESWGVATLMDKQCVLAFLRSSFPDSINRINIEVKKKKIFRDSLTVKPGVLTELVDAEVNQILLKRVGL